MTNNETQLIQMIRDSGNPEEALLKATLIILEFLKQPESFEEQAAVSLRELA